VGRLPYDWGSLVLAGSSGIAKITGKRNSRTFPFSLKLGHHRQSDRKMSVFRFSVCNLTRPE